jgi:hypothetical protein
VEIDLRQGVPGHLEDALFRPTLTGSSQTLTLAASCLPAAGGKVYLMFLNEGSSQVSVTTMGIAVDAALEPMEVPVECPL